MVKLTEKERRYLEDHKDWVDEGNFNTLLNRSNLAKYGVERFSGLPQFLYFDCGVDIFKTMTYIPNCCFMNLGGLEEFTVPENIKTIEEYAFDNCPDLKLLTVLNPNTQIKSNFNTCPDLVIRCHKNSEAEVYIQEYNNMHGDNAAIEVEYI